MGQYNDCARCHADDSMIMSFFNTEMICLGCQEKERNHPKYEEARAAETEALRSGDRNFQGIGKPEDL